MHEDTQFLEHHLLKRQILIEWSWHCYQNLFDHIGEGLFLGHFYSIPLVYMSVFMLKPHCFDYGGFVVSFEISYLVFPFPDCFDCSGPFSFYTNFKMSFSISEKKNHWNFDWDCIESVGCLGSIDILNNDVFQFTNMRYITVYFCCLLFLSVIFVLFVVWVFTTLVKLTAEYFILFDAVVNGLVFSISFSDSLLFMWTFSDSSFI